MNVSDILFATKWKEFLQSNLRKVVVSNWQRRLDAATKYTDLDNENLEDHFPRGDEACKEWMYLARMVAPNSKKKQTKTKKTDS